MSTESVSQAAKQAREEVELIARGNMGNGVFLVHELCMAWHEQDSNMVEFRRELFLRARKDGWRNMDIAAVTGLSRQRVQQIIDSPTYRQGSKRKSTHTKKGTST